MSKYYKFSIAFIAVFVIDQIIKIVILNGFDIDTSCISITLTLNKGVAFSMFAFLGEYLKYIQVALIVLVIGYLIWEKHLLSEFSIAIGFILAGGISNILDRFVHGGVVDYIHWHCGFEWAIFNFADIMINLGVAIILYLTFFKKKSK